MLILTMLEFFVVFCLHSLLISSADVVNRESFSSECNDHKLTCRWNEYVAAEPFIYIQKYALYDRFDLLDVYDDYAVNLNDQNNYEMKFSIFPFCVSDSQQTGVPTFPMNQYMFVMRVFYAQEMEMERLWSLSPNSNELKSTILSFSSEYSVLTITSDRLTELAEDKDTLVADSEETLQNKKEYVETLSVVMRVAQDILLFVENEYLPLCFKMHVTTVEADFFVKQQEMIITNIIAHHMENVYDNEYISEVAEIWNLKSLLHAYISQSIVPFINHILRTQPQQNSKLQAVPVMLVNQMSSYVVENETFTSILLVTDRQYENVTYHTSAADGSDASSAAIEDTVSWSEDTVTLSHSLRMLFIVTQGTDEEAVLHNVDGYGSSTLTHLECLHYTTISENSKRITQDNTAQQAAPTVHSTYAETVNHEFCMSVKNVFITNTVVVSPILSLLDRAERPIYTDISAKHHRAMDTPLRTFMQLSENNATEAVRKAIDFERSLLYHDHNYCPQGDDTPKILILGLAAGELHNFLLRYFPCITVRSVDINLDMFTTAQKYFGFGNSVCSAKVYNSTVNEMTEIETRRQNNNEHNLERSREIPGVVECRSEVIISDAWDYINYQVTRNRYYNDPITAQHIKPYEIRINTEYYDMIMFDVYDMLAASWHGETDSGESTPFVDRAASDASLTAVRDLLRPNVGIAVFHLHRDGQFSYYYNQIRKIFGSDQVVLFTVSGNDAMIVAGRDVFVSSSNLTMEQQVRGKQEQHQRQQKVDEQQCYSNQSEGEDEVCESHQDSPSNNVETYKPIAHPCTAPLSFANHATKLAEHWGFREETIYASKYSLNCVDYAGSGTDV